METFFISDTHFSHRNIIVFEPFHRPFQTIEEHDEELIKRWNSVVGKKDIVIHVGDFAMGSHGVEIASRLNGDKRLVLGNHDTAPTSNYLKHFTKLFGSLQIESQYIITHIPVHPQQFHRYKGNIHGHLHSKRVMKIANEVIDTEKEYESTYKQVEDTRYFNVSCEQINCTPISFDELKRQWRDRE